jgi:hypothetical protein
MKLIKVQTVWYDERIGKYVLSDDKYLNSNRIISIQLENTDSECFSELRGIGTVFLVDTTVENYGNAIRCLSKDLEKIIS